MSRESLFLDLAKTFKRAESFADRAKNPKLFAPVQLGEFHNAKKKVNALIQEIMGKHPGEWSDAEQDFLRPL